jgi:hypothetical protein
VTTQVDETNPEADEPVTPSGVGSRRVASRRWIAVGALLVLAASLVVGLHVRRYTTLSPIDELQHYDYLVKASRGQLVRNGERVGQEAMREEACRGIDAVFQTPPCDSATFDPSHYQELGYNTASSQSPIYYAISGLIARAMAALLGFESLFTAARLTGAFWLALGLAAVVGIARRIDVGRAGIVLACGVLLFSPVVLHAHATVNADAVLLAAGGAVMLATLVAEERGGRWLSLPVAAGFIAFAAEPTTIFASGTAALYLGLRSLGAWRRMPTKAALRMMLVGIGLLLAVVAANEATGWFKQSIALDVPAVTLPKDVQLAAPEITSEHVLTAIPALMTPLRDPYLPAFLSAPSVRATVRMTDLVLVSLLIAAATMSRPGSRVVTLAVSVLIVGFVAGPLLVLYNFSTSKVYFPIPSRYGLSMAPTIVAVAASVVTRRNTAITGSLLLAATGGFVITALL